MSKELELIAEHALTYCIADEGRCACGYWFDASDNPGVERIQRMHAAHVVSRLSEHGYSIVPNADALALSRAQTLAFSTERMGFGFEFSRGYNLAIDALRGILRAAADEDNP